MISHYVTCHVTAVSHASSSSKRKEKGKENKISIKSENKRKENKNCSYPEHPIILGSYAVYLDKKEKMYPLRFFWVLLCEMVV